MSITSDDYEPYANLFLLADELLVQIAIYLQQHDLAMLARASKRYYLIVQPLLWNRPKLSTLPMLMKFCNYVERPPQDFRDVSDEATYKEACKERADLIKSIHIRIPSTSLDLSGASVYVTKLTVSCPKAKISLMIQNGTGSLSSDPLIIAFPKVLLFIFTLPKDDNNSFENHIQKEALLCDVNKYEDVGRIALKQVLRRHVAENPRIFGEKKVTSMTQLDIEVAVERYVMFASGVAHVEEPLKPKGKIIWRENKNMSKMLDQLQRSPKAWVKECLGIWSVEELEGGSESEEKVWW